MTINWFTVAAQVINFLVLVFLLQRFLYGPIVRTMDQRKKEIRMRIEESEEERRKAEEEAERYRRKQQELEDERTSLERAMREEVESQRNLLVEQIRHESEERRRQWKEAIEQDEEQFLRDLRLRISDEFYSLARRALSDLADEELEKQAIRAFLKHLDDMDEDKWKEFEGSLNENGGSILVRSAFDIDEELRDEIRETLQQYVDGEVNIRYEVDSSIITGIELQAYSYVAAWQLDDYLNELEERARVSLRNQYLGDDETEDIAANEQTAQQEENSKDHAGRKPETA